MIFQLFLWFFNLTESFLVARDPQEMVLKNYFFLDFKFFNHFEPNLFKQEAHSHNNRKYLGSHDDGSFLLPVNENNEDNDGGELFFLLL